MAGGFEVLKERGFIKQCSNEEGLKKLLASERVTFYIGFDPTGSSLHAGHLLQLFAMSHLQRAGHRPITLIGGGTSRIGDPSGKTEMRKMMSLETIRANSECFKKQISRFLDFSSDRALMLDNAEWLADLNYIDFLRDIGSQFSVNRMLSFETYKMRLESGLSFIEFNYQILQSFDFLTLYRQHGCRLQMGGDDQWGNIVAGMDLVRRLESVECFALTSPLVTRSDGKKMGKTEKGALFLDPDLISPYEFYQYWLNVPDADVEKLLLLFTYLPPAEVSKLASLKDKEINHAKQVLAGELTEIVHGKEAAEQARSSSQAAFKQGGVGDMNGIPSTVLIKEEVRKGINVLELFQRSGLTSTISEARRLVEQGGAYVNGKNIRDIKTVFTSDAVMDGAILLRAGKKRYFRFSVD